LCGTSVCGSLLHNKELHNLYCPQNIIKVIKSRRMRWAWHVASMGEKRNVYRVLVRKSEGKRPVERPRYSFCFLVSLGGVRLSPLVTSATVGLLYQLWMIDDDYGAVGGMRIGRGNRITRRKPAPVPLCPPQFPHDLTWDRTRAAAVGSQ
jgi:hypothetical protein